MKEETKRVLTDSERDKAIAYYSHGYCLQDITALILAERNEKIERDMLREVGQCVSTHFNRQMYPVEFYGKVEE